MIDYSYTHIIKRDRQTKTNFENTDMTDKLESGVYNPKNFEVGESRHSIPPPGTTLKSTPPHTPQHKQVLTSMGGR